MSVNELEKYHRSNLDAVQPIHLQKRSMGAFKGVTATALSLETQQKGTRT